MNTGQLSAFTMRVAAALSIIPVMRIQSGDIQLTIRTMVCCSYNLTPGRVGVPPSPRLVIITDSRFTKI